MKSILLFCLTLGVTLTTQAQGFIRSELPTQLATPWEIVYGQDGYLWLTESKGNVSRVNPLDGSKTIVFTASDYFHGSSLEDYPIF